MVSVLVNKMQKMIVNNWCSLCELKNHLQTSIHLFLGSDSYTNRLLMFKDLKCENVFSCLNMCSLGIQKYACRI